MSDRTFEQLVHRLLLSPGVDDTVVEQPAEAQILQLHAGLERAMVDGTAFDQLIALYADNLPGVVQANESMPSELLARLLTSGMHSLEHPTLLRMVRTPAWIVELREALLEPSQYWIDTAERLYWGTMIGPRYPGRVLLGIPGPVAQATLRSLVMREAKDVLALVPLLPNGRITQWTLERLCGPAPLLPQQRRAFLQLTARVIRELRQARARQLQVTPAAEPTTVMPRKTLTEVAKTSTFDTVASEASDAAFQLAEASCTLDALFPEKGELLLLAFYGGLALDELAEILNQPVDHLRDELDVIRDWISAQSAFELSTTPDSDDSCRIPTRTS